MTRLRIHHRTRYLYRQPVHLWPHRLMLRPRESRTLSLLSMTLETMPPSEITWAHDVFGNAVATAQFVESTDELVVESRFGVVLDAGAWPIFPIDASAIIWPFAYSADDQIDLGALMRPQYPDANGAMAGWARGFVLGARTDTLALLKDVSEGVSRWISYEVRDDEGTQSPQHTLDRRRGSCRDFAVMFAEAVRHLGFGARIVSGYLCDAVAEGLLGSSNRGSTHAWAEVYVPGAGWITFDPTNRSLGGANLVPVAVARDISQIVPVSGSFSGAQDAFGSLSVEVDVVLDSAPFVAGTAMA